MFFPQTFFSGFFGHRLAADSVRRKPRNIVRPCRAYPDVLITARKGLLDENAFDLLRIEEGFLALSGMTGGGGTGENGSRGIWVVLASRKSKLEGRKGLTPSDQVPERPGQAGQVPG